jgi:hypothetical protein
MVIFIVVIITLVVSLTGVKLLGINDDQIQHPWILILPVINIIYITFIKIKITQNGNKTA